MKNSEYTDFLIECGNPKAFDQTIQQLGAAVLCQNDDNSYAKNIDGYYTMRVYGDSGFVIFAIKNQGYGKIIKQLSNPYNQ